MTPNIKLLLLTYIAHALQSVSSNYYEPNAYFQNPDQQDYYEYEETDDYDTVQRHHRRHGETVHQYNQDNHDDCSDKMQDCSCNRCDNPTPCCQNFCTGCAYISHQPDLVFVPYPYPLMAPGTEKNGTDWALRSKVSTREPVTITTERVTTTKVPLNGDTPRYVEDAEMPVKIPVTRNSGSSRYMMTSLRRTKPTWMPKYGIVPIPDNLAEKLMSQIREVKDYKYKARETV